jgi:uncharacterized protein (DUF1778 family)
MATKDSTRLKIKKPKTKKLDLGLSQEQESFLEQAAKLENKPLVNFILEAAYQAAENVMLDQRRFLLKPKQWSLFIAALDAPAKVLPHLSQIIPDQPATKSKKKGKAMEPRRFKKKHDVSQFDCGNESLNVWLKKSGLESDTSRSTFTHVLAEKNKVIAYYSFTVGSVEPEDGQAKAGKGDGRGAIPILLLNRIAIDKRYHGQGLSAMLTRHALWRAYLLSKESVPLRCLVVVAANKAAESFYSGLDFQPWPVDPWRMWLLIKDLKHTLAR